MKRLLISLAILISAGWMIWQLPAGNPTLQIPAQTQYLEWFGKNITLTEMNSKGQLKQMITAHSLQHYMPDNTTDLSQVDLHIFSSEEQPYQWQLTSDKGRLFHGEDKQDVNRIDLWHDVQLLRPADSTQSAVTINTSTLAIFPEKEYAHTDQYTIVNQPGHQMSGNGMEIFFPTQEFYLINNVSSTHENAS
jgi:lipopolysaccharide export system protein LptC